MSTNYYYFLHEKLRTTMLNVGRAGDVLCVTRAHRRAIKCVIHSVVVLEFPVYSATLCAPMDPISPFAQIILCSREFIAHAQSLKSRQLERGHILCRTTILEVRNNFYFICRYVNHLPLSLFGWTVDMNRLQNHFIFFDVNGREQFSVRSVI